MCLTVFHSPARIINGSGSLSLLAEETERLNADRVLLVADPSFVQNGTVASIQIRLQERGIESTVFSGIEPDPRCEIATSAAACARNMNAQAIIAIGGGSTLDIAKVAALLAVDTRDVRELVGIGNVTKPGLLTILIPTTAGTGSEVTTVAILSDEQAHLKVGIVTPYMLAQCVLLDAELTRSLPPGGTAASGIDALIHAIEAYTGNTATELTDLYAEKAIRLISAHIRSAWARGDDMEARSAMLTGAFYAGLAFSNSGCAAVHAFAYPIGAEFHIPHGIANALMLLPVLRMTIPAKLERYAAIAAMLGENTEELSLRASAFKTLDALEALSTDLRIPRKLSQYGVTEAHVPALSDAVMQVTRLLGNNPYTITRNDAETIYRESL